MYVYTYEIKPTIKEMEQSSFLKLSHALQSIFAATLLPSNYYSHANFCPMNSFTFSGILYTWNHMLRAKLLQSCPTLCNPMDCSLPVSSVLGIFQAKMLEWVAISFYRRSFQPMDQTSISQVSYIDIQILYYQRHLGLLQINCPCQCEFIFGLSVLFC